MGGRKFTRVDTGDRMLEEIQDNIERVIDRLDRKTVISGVDLPAAATVTIKHPLDRVPIGWAIVRAQGGYPQAYETGRTIRDITLQSANACTVDIEVW